jgi:hypothetical protein
MNNITTIYTTEYQNFELSCNLIHILQYGPNSEKVANLWPEGILKNIFKQTMISKMFKEL